MLFALLLQAATPLASAPPPAGDDAGGHQWSVLAQPCAAKGDPGDDVVVCGRPDAIQPRLPLARFRGPPDHPVPSNPDLSPSVALNGAGISTECGAYGENCEPFGGQYITPMTLIKSAVDVAKRATKTRRYKNKGEAIPLDPPADTDMTSRIHP